MDKIRPPQIDADSPGQIGLNHEGFNIIYTKHNIKNKNWLKGPFIENANNSNDLKGIQGQKGELIKGIVRSESEQISSIKEVHINLKTSFSCSPKASIAKSQHECYSPIDKGAKERCYPDI